MLHPAQSEQIRRLLANMAEGRLELDAGESRIPVSSYTSEARFREEREVLFRGFPLILGADSQLDEPGACMTHDLLGLPIVLVRDKQGELRAFLNVCRHRGTRVVSEEGVCRKNALLCPYHNWMYGLDGGLLRIPRGEEGFPGCDRAELGLVRLPLEVRHGLVWVRPERDGAIDVDAFLGDIGGDLEAFGMGGHRHFRQGRTLCKANWKLMIDAFSEAYHVQRLHKATLSGFFADLDAVFDRVERHLRSAVARKAMLEGCTAAEAEADPRNHVTFTYYLFPNSILVFSPDYVTHLGFFPLSPDETVVVDTMLVAHEPASEKERDHWQRSYDLINGQVFRNEDFHIAEQGQIGMRCGANEHLLVGRFETGVRVFHEILDEALAAAT